MARNVTPVSYTSVVRIFATQQRPDYDNPWQSASPSSSSGSGVVVGPGQVVTGAHVVADATFIQVQKPTDPNKLVARVEAICHDCDLALLRVDDPAFMDGMSIEEIGAVPELRDRVSVVGFPVGGEEISITEGVVSRVEVQRYSHSQRNLLAITVDAAINSGNSGGPVFKDGKVVGIAFQTRRNAKNIGELVPAPLIRRFLDAVRSRRPVEIPGLGVTTQGLENPLLRRQVGLKGKASGVLVTGVEYGSSAWERLRPGDALLEIDGLPIANNGTVRFNGRFRTRFNVVVGLRHLGERLDVQILRAGRRRRLKLALAPEVRLVPRRRHDTEPRFCVYGGLVFQALTLDFLETWVDWWDNAPSELQYHYYHGRRTPERHEIIVLSHVLGDELNAGYEHLANETVAAVDGAPPADLEALVTALERAEGPLQIRLSSGSVIALDPALTREANVRINARYRITRSSSLSTTSPTGLRKE